MNIFNLKRIKNAWLFLLLSGCIEPYSPPELENNPDILVVDGFLDGTKGSCTVRLTRTQRLGSTEPPPIETSAIVQLEEKDGSTLTLINQFNGNYSISNLVVSPLKVYRILVRTQDGEEYASDYTALKNSPPIDSLTWSATNQGIQVEATTHDPDNASRYYLWSFVETWQYTSAYYSNMEFQNGTVSLRSEDIYDCWQEQSSTSIIIGSSDKLSQDVIYKQPITVLPTNTDKYQIRYSILVQQRVLTKEAYNFWLELQKNTENLGSLFDPQPSQVLGNIHYVNRPLEPVLGYFSAGFTSEKRLFIRYADLPPGFPFIRDFPGCKEDTILLEDLPTFGSTGKLLTTPVTIGGIILIGYGYSTVDCVDCRSKGGTNVQPDFW
ncbi:MAG: DUF4249 domain-containing protein [Cyclobacteriaceae bacterium]|nr:DUF4249 domain-containing protein [Cyclobacteriaceae bacterium]